MAANAPVFFLHPRESFFPCTVEWFLQRAQLCVMRNVMLSRRVQRGALRNNKVLTLSVGSSARINSGMRLASAFNVVI